jgi:hypothetical protein
VSSTQCLHGAVVEDLLWNSLDGNVLKQERYSWGSKIMAHSQLYTGAQRASALKQTSS